MIMLNLGCKDKKKTAAQQGRFPGDPKVWFVKWIISSLVFIF
jgi:hypothetical protein